MSLKLVTGPSEEPITVAAAKLDMRVDDDFTDHDDLIGGLIAAGRQYAETVTRRALVTQTWRLTADRFPSPMAGRLTEYWLGQQWGLAGMGGVSQFPPTDRTGYGFLLPLSPLATVGSIQYTDPGGSPQTLDPAAYKVDTDSEPPRILPAFGYAWPTTRQEVNAVRVTFTAGYGAGTAVPEGIRRAVVMWVKAHYEAAFDDVKNAEYERRIKAVDLMLTPFRVLTV